MITFQVEKLSDELENLKPLFPDHWTELALNQDKVPLDPQYQVYLDRETAGQVLFVCGREKGRIVAYFVGFVTPALHYQTCLTLQMDIFYLHPDYREGDSLTQVEADMISMQLFEAVEVEAKRRGVKRVFYGSKFHKDASKLFEALGLVEVERYYSAYWG